LGWGDLAREGLVRVLDQRVERLGEAELLRARLVRGGVRVGVGVRARVKG
jgi:hypothetical protein